jgi:exodeoxyribonuclease VII large subunit
VSGRLEALSPLAVLGRGYALVYGADGGLLRSAGESAVGEGIRVRLGSGALGATVTEVERGREIEDTVTEKGT